MASEALKYVQKGMSSGGNSVLVNLSTYPSIHPCIHLLTCLLIHPSIHSSIIYPPIT